MRLDFGTIGANYLKKHESTFEKDNALVSPVKTVNSVIDCITPHLAFVFNKCLDDGLFSNPINESKVVPIFKCSSKSNLTNFKPTPALPTLSKIFEKLILNELLLHFYSNNLMSKKQLVFTWGRSKIDAGVELDEKIFEAWEESQNATGVCCHLSKAFNCVNHGTLIRKLHHYGVTNLALDLLASYLTNRVQKVDVNNMRSSGFVRMGVLERSDPLDYDDVNIVISKFEKLLTLNRLRLKRKKTKCVEFSLPNVKNGFGSILIQNDILFVDTIVFLGLTLDNKLQWGSSYL
ncbi:RNA-directed DNA polymerase from mobile element jockey [Eumeta japonica]|uniref:RNA-directed DNA polymerase from mobile element jockey n=1 Tax=Eumeta variegata TaxID=151549 RepID=A0A4C1W7B9_EUMVA|nr:RNA-directed DNA polymerase from mobile element jockey [Eumeta japonica]